MVTMSNYEAARAYRKTRNQNYLADVGFLDNYDSDDSYYQKAWHLAQHYMRQHAVFEPVSDEGIDWKYLWTTSVDWVILLVSIRHRTAA
jgi:hypothetical protein